MNAEINPISQFWHWLQYIEYPQSLTCPNPGDKPYVSQTALKLLN